MKTPFKPATDWSMVLKTASVAALALALVACGGGGGGGSGGGGGGGGAGQSDGGGAVNTDSLLKGVVLDGYLVGAKVCLDLNVNWVCDSGEPSTTSTTGGKYTLDVSPLKYTDTYTKAVIAEVGPDALDEASGKTLKAQGLTGYVLASWGGPKPILSVMNTLGLAKLSADGITDVIDAFSIAHLLEDSSMSATSEDYFDGAAPLSSSERDLAKRTGRVLSAALSAAQLRLKTELPSLYGVDSSGLGLRAARLLTQALRETRPPSSTETESEQLARANAQTASIPLVLDHERANRVNATEVAVTEASTILSGGVVDVGDLATSPRSYVRYKSSGNTGSLSTTGAIWRSGAWSADAFYQSNGAVGYRVPFRTDTLPEVSGTVSIAAPTVQIVGAVLREKYSSDTNVPSREIRVLQRDVGGLPYASVPGLETVEGNFGPGQKAYQLRRKSLQNEYVFDRVATFFSSLDAFIDSPRTCFGGICWSITKRALGNTAEFAGTMAFSTTSSGGSLNLGEGKYVDETINGVRILHMIAIPIAVQNRSADWSIKEGRYPLFADFDSKLWAGRYTPANTVWYSNTLLSADGFAGLLTSASLGTALP